MRPIFILGRMDHEMRRIQEHLEVANAVVYQAQFVTKSGILKRIGAATAYKFNAVAKISNTKGPIDKSKIAVYLIECEPSGIMFMDENLDIHVNCKSVPYSRRVQYAQWMDIQYVRSIDHHREGDFGFDIGYEGYFEASSIGQVIKLLGIAPGEEDYYCAASDHCLSHAYAGNCFNVQPAKMLAYRIKVIAKGRHPGSLLREIHACEALLRECPVINIGGYNVIDGRAIQNNMIREAAARMPQPTLVEHYEEEEHVCLNSLNPEIIRAWVDGYGAKLGYHGCIGMPMRGVGFGTK